MEEKIDHLTYEIIEICLLAGKIMLQSGAETSRVEDTMTRIAAALGIPRSHSYVTPTGIIFSTDGAEPAKLIRITERTTDLHKVAEVNSVSRNLSNGDITMSEARLLLREIEAHPHTYPIWFQIVAASIASGCFLIMFQGGWFDFIPAMLCGGLGLAAVIFFQRLVAVKFFAEFSAAFLVGLFAFFFTEISIGYQVDKIIIGSVMPLVPGLLITNAVRDLMSGHLVSGLSKGAEAFLTAFAIGTGIALVFILF
ncbi:hypothetical protein BVG16_24545 [Paenibacillus selenitireducens]|uniref:Threonine/serine exporter-like N-terminal domain-containing protein n=1 Tax=Paenibacillus selenitireducens TaxID=1324314 RepID=A0A1T2X3G9_9BACL|nr:threonine/serine exporter family protein [Paenibacillus selenitireducens]OPA74365.1 hypothetical protein BVG16_24545 [Paenibacillus selenitireducens]